MNLIHSGKIDLFFLPKNLDLVFTLADRLNGIGIKNLYLMQDIYNRIQQMNIDYVEYFHLKLLLFSRWGKSWIAGISP